MVRAAAPLTAALVLALVLSAASPASAQTWTAAAPTPTALPPVVNLQHTLLVRKAFAQDKELAKLNLGVLVENRVATLWGPVPSSKLLSRAFKETR